MRLTWKGRTVLNRVLWVLSMCLLIAGVVLLAKGSADTRRCRNNYYYPCYRGAQQRGEIQSRSQDRYWSRFCSDYANSNCNLDAARRYTYIGGALFAVGFVLTVSFCFCAGANFYEQDQVIVTTHTIPQQGIAMQQGPMYQPQYAQQQQYGQPQFVQQPQYGQPAYGQPAYGPPQYDPNQPQYAQPVTGYPGHQGYNGQNYGKA